MRIVIMAQLNVFSNFRMVTYYGKTQPGHGKAKGRLESAMVNWATNMAYWATQLDMRRHQLGVELTKHMKMDTY